MGKLAMKFKSAKEAMNAILNAIAGGWFSRAASSS
jgi:hypothetical protein